MGAFWGVIAILVAYYLISTYFWQIVAGIAAIALCIVITKWNREAKEEEMRRQEAEIRSQRREEKRIREEKAEAEKRRQAALHQEKMLAAIRAGVDVCQKCKTIRPLRCKCGKCIESCYCHRYDTTHHQCKDCSQSRKRKECLEAKELGEDVCWDCLTVNPDRCQFCGRCTKCQDTSGNICYDCGDSSSDDD